MSFPLASVYMVVLWNASMYLSNYFPLYNHGKSVGLEILKTQKAGHRITFWNDGIALMKKGYNKINPGFVSDTFKWQSCHLYTMVKHDLLVLSCICLL